MGVTGTRSAVDTGAPRLVERTRAIIDKGGSGLPVGLGLGISNGAQAAEVAGFADGVIVGSAFIRRMLDAPDLASGLAGVRALAEEMAEGIRAGRCRRARGPGALPPAQPMSPGAQGSRRDAPAVP